MSPRLRRSRALRHPNPRRIIMKLHRLILPAITAFVLTVPAFAAETHMGKEMDKLNSALKAVGEKVDDPKAKQSNLAKIEEAKRSAESASRLQPAMTKDIPAADKAKFLADF